MATTDGLERLHSAPPTEFTAARNRIVAQLRKAGRSADARAVARLRKPSAALWAVNRLAHIDPKRMVSFIDAVDRLRRAQLRDPRAVTEALRTQRAALEALVENAKALLTGQKLTVSQPTIRRISDTLMGAAVDRTHARALRRGDLREELPAPGFEAFSGARGAAPTLRLVRPKVAPSDRGREPRSVEDLPAALAAQLGRRRQPRRTF